MHAVWFVLVVAMLTAYVILDGFDLGAGAIHLLAAKSEEERRLILRSIGPVWDGNEVWLIAAGGTLYFAFPLLYASSFSGFYLPLNIVLWLLILRGIGIEFRLHTENELWHSLFDGIFSLSSALLAVFFGAALGNVLRGVPLGPDHFFFEPLWTNFSPGANPGILDWYTCGAAVLALVALALHGSLYVAYKTEGGLHERLLVWSKRLLPLLALLTVVGIPATTAVRARTLQNFKAYPITFAIPLGVALSLAGIWFFLRRRDVRSAFFSSCGYLAAMLVGAAVALAPSLLPSSSDPSRDITIYNAATGAYAMQVGLIWWSLGIILAIAYFVFLYWMFRGKVSHSRAIQSSH